MDLCAGIGGFGVALSQVTPHVSETYFSEIAPAATQCYRNNFPEAHALGDAYRVTDWPQVDLVTAGFPCQPFSSANTFKSETDTRRNFVEQVLVAVSKSGATRVVLENVPQLQTVDGGARFTYILDTLASWGFRTTHAVLNSAHFGVPQMRKRLYICARRDGAPPLDIEDYVPSEPVILGDIIDRP
jgi:DNA (cytosine-5)-methyltransferase 1